MNLHALSPVGRYAKTMIPVLIGLALGLFLRDLTWPGLPDRPWLRFALTGGIVIAILILSFCLTYDKDRVKRVARGASMVIFLVLVALSVVCTSLFVPANDKSNILRGLALVFFAVIPCWLYLQFILVQRKTIWTEYVSNLFRLHLDEYQCLPEPPKDSCFHGLWRAERRRTQSSDEEKLYTEKFEAVLGCSSGMREHPFACVLNFRTFLPVAVATLLISAGWLLVMGWTREGSPTPPPSRPPVSQPGPETSSEPAKMPEGSLTPRPSRPPVTQPGPKTSSQPEEVNLDCFRFAFLGAYFFILQSVVRRYFQGDLTPDAYINAAVRIIIVCLLVWVVVYAASRGPSSSPAAPDNKFALGSGRVIGYLPILAFVIGVFPVIGWRLIENLIKVTFQWAIPTLQERFPLDKLDGLNVWYESRLMEEGIENMENLATANFVDLMLNTRVPINRLVDWVDQSLLYLHLGEEGEENKWAFAKLRSLGVRTATDVVDLMESKQPIGDVAHALNKEGDGGPAILQCIYATLRDEPNFFHVRAWKSFQRTILEGRQGQTTLAGVATPPSPPTTTTPLTPP